MNSETPSSQFPVKQFNWRDDLMAARDLATRDQESFAYVVGWMEDWGQRQNLEMGRDAARR